ncbi:MAG: hypothetical protein JST59_01425 [Actinobacteria bacterium]|nr:hypothetical protein [Actinomycetota bacterium]
MSSSDSEEESYTTRTTMKVDSMKESHCGSNQTKVTEEEDPGRWSTPVKHEVPMSHSMIPNRETMQAEVTLRQFKGSAVFDSKNNKTIGGLE